MQIQTDFIFRRFRSDRLGSGAAAQDKAAPGGKAAKTVAAVKTAKAAKAVKAAAAMTCLVVVSSLGFLSGCGPTLPDVTGPKITIGIAYDRPYLSNRRAEKFSGLDVTVATYVAHQLGYSADQITWVEAQNSNRSQLFDSQDVDMIVGVHQLLNDSDDDISFSGPYMTVRQRILVRKMDKNKYTNVTSLRATDICAIKGELSASVERMLIGQKTQFHWQGRYSQCISALFSGSVSAVIGDETALGGYATAMNNHQMVLTGPILAKNQYGIALPKGDDRLRALVDQSLHSLVGSSSFRTAASAFSEATRIKIRTANIPRKSSDPSKRSASKTSKKSSSTDDERSSENQ